MVFLFLHPCGPFPEENNSRSDIARAFAQKWMILCLVRHARHTETPVSLARLIRDGGGAALSLPTDLRDEEVMIVLINYIETDGALTNWCPN